MMIYHITWLATPPFKVVVLCISEWLPSFDENQTSI